MKKFMAVVKREYVQRVRSKMFVVITVLGPLMMVLFTVVPALMSQIKAGGPTRLVIVDESGKVYQRVRASILTERGESRETATREQATEEALKSNGVERVKDAGNAMEQNYEVEQVTLDGRSLEEVKAQLQERVRRHEVDAFLILSPDILQGGQAELYGRNAGDVFTRGRIQDRLNDAVRQQRMAEAKIDEARLREMSKPVKLISQKVTETGVEKDSGAGFWVVFTVGFIIYITILLYGQVMLAAVIEEKETRIAEVLFSSIRAFPLMMGKLIGVSLVALTQLAIWGLAIVLFALFGVGVLAAQGMDISMPHLPPTLFAYFFLFFLLGFFIYATIYALIGSMVTTAQEGGQLAFPVILLLVMGFYLAFPVIRSPNSSFAFWVSMVPFFSPITMLVRIVTETPPVWQIMLSLFIGFSTVVLLIWLAARIYRIGMLMYGKRASIPEVLRWVRQG